MGPFLNLTPTALAGPGKRGLTNRQATRSMWARFQRDSVFIRSPKYLPVPRKKLQAADWQGHFFRDEEDKVKVLSFSELKTNISFGTAHALVTGVQASET